MRGRLILLAAVAAVLLAAPAAYARQLPSAREYAAITPAVRKALHGWPQGCYGLTVTVSTVNPSYALAVPFGSALPECARYLGSGECCGVFVLHRTTRWRVICESEDTPECRPKVPASVARDLLRLR